MAGSDLLENRNPLYPTRTVMSFMRVTTAPTVEKEGE